jgi:phosphoribosylamine---glycine ligase
LIEYINKKNMNVLLIGNGGREHALAKAINSSNLLTNLYIAPGNPGTAMHGTNVEIQVNEFEKLEAFVLKNDVTLLVVGPEAPLVDGIADYFKKHAHICIVGPAAFGAQLEGSKAFAKKFMLHRGIPTAKYFECDATNLNQGIDFLHSLKPPFVLKADGLAAGKGVLIIDDVVEAEHELTSMLNGKFGRASSTVVIEEFLTGIEFSMFAITDGKSYLLLPEAKDYKRIGEGDTGLNTGGMGAVSPVPFVDEAMKNKVIERIVIPTIEGFAHDEIDYRGFVFFGLINVNGDPYVIEYNCRMGDPETEVVIPRIKSDLLPVFMSLKDQTLDQHTIEINSNIAVTVMLVSGGYPGDYATGHAISLGKLQDDSFAYHAGTKINGEQLVTSGGRVIAVTSFGNTIQDALDKSYESIDKIDFVGMHFRRDIGKDLL